MKDNLKLLSYFKNHYLNTGDILNILTIGHSVELSTIFDESNWTNNILDTKKDDSVNIVVNDIYCWHEVTESYDVIISTDYIQSLKFFWLTMVQIEKNLNYGGYSCIIVPKILSGEDYYNFSNKSLKSLAQYVNLEVVELIENDSNICLIACKSNELLSKLNEYHEKEMVKSIHIDLLEKYESELSNFKKSNIKINDNFLKIRDALISLNTLNKLYCPICKSEWDSFLPFGNPSRSNAKCPICGSLERHRFIYLFLNQKTEVFEKNVKILDFAPSYSLYNAFMQLDNIEYFPVENKYGNDVNHIEDMENLDFPDNNFDAIFSFHFLDTIENDINHMRELYRMVKSYDNGGFVLICVALIREKTFENSKFNTPELRAKHYHDKNRFRIYGHDIKERLESVGFKVEKYKSEEIFNSELMKMCSIRPDYLFLCMK